MARRDALANPSVMATRRAKGDNEGLNDEERLWKLLDFFPTPPWGGRAGAELLLRYFAEPDDLVLEPACGQGHMAEPLREYFPLTEACDVHDHGRNYPVRDWLDEDAWPSGPCCDWVVTNPPFNLAERFITLGLQRASKGVALLLRTVFVESVGRYPLFEGGLHPLTLFAPFSERLPMTLGEWVPEAGTATSYAWFIWAKDFDPMPPKWIPPGARERLWKPDDPARFGRKEPLPLFPGFDVV